MYACSITLSVALSETSPQELDIRISTTDDDNRVDLVRQDFEIHVLASDGDHPAIAAVPMPTAAATPAEGADAENDAYVLGGYAGI